MNYVEKGAIKLDKNEKWIISILLFSVAKSDENSAKVHASLWSSLPKKQAFLFLSA